MSHIESGQDEERFLAFWKEHIEPLEELLQAEGMNALILLGHYDRFANETYFKHGGSGCWHAKLGMAHEFLDNNAAMHTANEIGSGGEPA